MVEEGIDKPRTTFIRRREILEFEEGKKVGTFKEGMSMREYLIKGKR